MILRFNPQRSRSLQLNSAAKQGYYAGLLDNVPDLQQTVMPASLTSVMFPKTTGVRGDGPRCMVCSS